MAKLVDDPPERERVEPRLGVAVVHPRHHRQHDVEIASDQAPRVSRAVLRPAADDIDQVPDLSKKRITSDRQKRKTKKKRTQKTGINEAFLHMTVLCLVADKMMSRTARSEPFPHVFFLLCIIYR